MSKICRTFAPNFKKAMNKMKYIQPEMEVTVLLTKPLMGDPLMGSGTGPQPAPKRNGEVID